MKKNVLILGCLCIFVIVLSAAEKPSEFYNYWPQWRGPNATGVSLHGKSPAVWNENKNVKWKIEIPGKGHATPIVWGDQTFVLTAIETDKEGAMKKQDEEENQERRSWMNPSSTIKIHKFTVISIDRRNGKILWKRTVKEEMPEESTHELGSWASNSAVTDGKHVYAYFGSRGLYCLDMQGNLKWERDFGQMSKKASFGEGSSPVLYDDKIFIVWDHEGESFITALNKKTGETIWKKDRDESTAWSTPLVVKIGESSQVITSASTKIRSYDVTTGKLIWECTGMTGNVIPCPIQVNDIVYVMSGFRGSALMAIDIKKANGILNDTEAILWEYNEDTPYTPSPVIVDNRLYFLKVNKAILTCLDTRDGKVNYGNQKLEGIGDVFASLTGTQDYIYVIGKNGTTGVVKQGPQFELLSKNRLEDKFIASPAIVGNRIYLRGEKYLYCIAED